MSALRRFVSVRAGVFVADARLFDAVSRGGASCLEELSDAEREELALIASPKRHRQFIASRSLLRRALQLWAGDAARNWMLAAEPGGRPYLRSGAADDRPPAISLSHSGHHALCALASAGAVGIDVEEIRRRDVDGLAREALSESERALLAPEPSRRLEDFYQLWTLKEAASKALGTGLATPFRELVFDRHGSQILLRPNIRVERAAFYSFAPAAGAIAALALFPPAMSEPPTVTFHVMTALDRLEVATPDILGATAASE